MKTLKKFDIWDGKEFSDDKYEFVRVSRWLKVKQNYTPNKKNQLWDYVTDSSGYHPYQENFDKTDGLYLDYFTHNGRNYALEQFYAFGSIADSIGHHCGYYENGQKYFLSGFDNESYYEPLICIEVDEYGENVRLYEEKRKGGF